MSKIYLMVILLFLSARGYASPLKISFHPYISEDSVNVVPIPYPQKLTSAQLINKEARRLIHFLKRGFIGISANYSTGRSYSNYGPVVGIQVPSRVGFRLWGGLNQGRTMDLKKDYMIDTKVSGINGHRVGLGVKLRGELSLDLEYQTIHGEQSVQNNSYIMSLSAPLNL